MFWLTPTDPVNSSWVASNAKSAGERSVTLAIMIMAANCGGIVGSQLFQAADKPLYYTGWTVIVSLVSMGLLMATLANVQYRLANRLLKRSGKKVVEEDLYKY